MMHLQAASCYVCQGAGLWVGQQGGTGGAKAAGGLIGSPSVSGTEQMSEQKDQSLVSFQVCVCTHECVYE